MPTPKKPPKQHEPCLCGCGRLSRSRSKYYEEACRSRYWRRKHVDAYNVFLKKRKDTTERRAERAAREKAQWEAWIAVSDNKMKIFFQLQILKTWGKKPSAWLVLELIRADGTTLPNAFEPYLRKYLNAQDQIS